MAAGEPAAPGAAANDAVAGRRKVAAIAGAALVAGQHTIDVLSHEGMLSVVTAAESMEDVETAVRRLAESVQELAKRASDIDAALSTIKGVNRQTRLLAFNAKIIASHAGATLGGGFSVVADEMQKLASQTGASAAEIALITAAVHQQVRGVVDDASQVGKSVKDATARVTEIGGALRNVMHSAMETTRCVEEIDRSADLRRTGGS
ncbi:MAG: hypothetical protein HY903_05845 [Deltaproteobacteria bacterium]|nr:hypothetical protein [Deltaproteobacteria bacterium]